MAGDIHALILIAVPLATLAAVAVLKHRSPTARQLAVALSLTGLATLPITMTRHMCDEGQHLTQWLIPAPCLLAVLLLIESAAWRRLAAGLVCVGMVGLSCHFEKLAHDPGWTGNPKSGAPLRAAIRAQCQAAAVAAAQTDFADAAYPAGRLRDLPGWPALREILEKHPPTRRQVGRAWHTWLTGLYPYTVVAQDYWFPGGRFDKGVAKLELRDFPSPPPRSRYDEGGVPP